MKDKKLLNLLNSFYGSPKVEHITCKCNDCIKYSEGLKQRDDLIKFLEVQGV